MSDQVFECGHPNSIVEITFTVAGEEKKYKICKTCQSLDCFNKFVIKRVPIGSHSADDVPIVAAAASGGGGN